MKDWNKHFWINWFAGLLGILISIITKDIFIAILGGFSLGYAFCGNLFETFLKRDKK